MNEFGEIYYISIDDSNLSNSQAVYIDTMLPALSVAVFEKNLFYALSSTEDKYLLFHIAISSSSQESSSQTIS